MAGPVMRVPYELAKAFTSSTFFAAIARNIPSMRPGVKITRKRTGESVRLHQAWGMPLPTVIEVPAGKSCILSPNGYLSLALNNDEVLLFVVMGVKGYADSGGRFEFEHEIRAARVTGGSLDLEPLSRSGL